MRYNELFKTWYDAHNEPTRGDVWILYNRQLMSNPRRLVRNFKRYGHEVEYIDDYLVKVYNRTIRQQAVVFK